MLLVFALREIMFAATWSKTKNLSKMQKKFGHQNSAFGKTTSLIKVAVVTVVAVAAVSVVVVVDAVAVDAVAVEAVAAAAVVDVVAVKTWSE